MRQVFGRDPGAVIFNVQRYRALPGLDPDPDDAVLRSSDCVFQQVPYHLLQPVGITKYHRLFTFCFHYNRSI
ncbi:hypothetical protein SDC9_179891 [bioreactor metagenome]|uniref:Uncharacterized protein n=1 Tax=bioreactor metagenome TaxID=1076179 RepID=A0A645H9E9_9ZZZZ